MKRIFIFLSFLSISLVTFANADFDETINYQRHNAQAYVGETLYLLPLTGSWYDAGEVDFVVMKHNGEREYYQVAYTANDENTLKREISSLRKIKDTYPKYFLTVDFDNANIVGIRKIKVIDWVLGSRLI